VLSREVLEHILSVETPTVRILTRRLAFISLAMTAFGGPDNHDARARQLHWLATTLGRLAERDQLLVDEWLDQVATADFFEKADDRARPNGDSALIEWMLVRVRWLDVLQQIHLPQVDDVPTRAKLKVDGLF
jgi:hypothetical protein